VGLEEAPVPEPGPGTPSPESNVTRALPPKDANDALVHTSLELHEKGDRYEVIEELGRGGMGEVHLCFDRRIGRQVARKRRAKDAAELKRFLLEASVQGQLEHPTIVPLHDLAVGEDGELYFTMKAIRGRTLKIILAARRDADPKTLAQFPTRKLLQAFSHVCLGVAFAHSRGVIHRDLKPDNLMLGEFGEVYVLDWGVAKLTVAGETDDEIMRVPLRGSVTKIGSMIGTAGYMSPEQCTGESRIDERSDVYSLGAILFEIIAGESLHAGTSLEKVDSTLAGVDVRARGIFWPRELAELKEACARATTVARDDRMQSARDLADAIELSLARQHDAQHADTEPEGVRAHTSEPPPTDAESGVKEKRPVAVVATPEAPRRRHLVRRWARAAALVVAVGAAHSLLVRDSWLSIAFQLASLAMLAVAASRDED